MTSSSVAVPGGGCKRMRSSGTWPRLSHSSEKCSNAGTLTLVLRMACPPLAAELHLSTCFYQVDRQAHKSSLRRAAAIFLAESRSCKYNPCRPLPLDSGEIVLGPVTFSAVGQ